MKIMISWKVGFFAFFLALICFSSCSQQELLIPDNELLEVSSLISDELSTVPDVNQIPKTSIPERTQHNTATLEIDTRSCRLIANKWHDLQSIGSIYVFDDTLVPYWTWSGVHQTYIYIPDGADPCGSSLKFYADGTICGGLSGWMWDNSPNDNKIWNYRQSWTKKACN